MAKSKKKYEADAETSKSKPQHQIDSKDGMMSRRRWHTDQMPDKGLFAIIAIVGFALIVTTKLWTDIPSWIIAVLATLTMFFYLVMAMRIPQLVLRLDRLGDNVYYLGFIFTLASLSAALMQIQNSESVVKSVLGSFGIALMTTIFGVGLRVVLVQMRGELDEIEEETRRSLVERSETLKDEIGSLITDFSVLKTSISQLSSEVVEATSVTFDKRLDLVAKASESAAKRLDESFTSQLKNISGIEQTFERMQSMSEDATSKMATTFETNSSSIRDVSEEALSAIRESTAKQEAMLVNATEAFKSKIELANQISERVQQSKLRDKEAVDSILTMANAMDSGMKEMLEQMTVLSETIDLGIKELISKLEHTLASSNPRPASSYFWRRKDTLE